MAPHYVDHGNDPGRSKPTPIVPGPRGVHEDSPVSTSRDDEWRLLVNEARTERDEAIAGNDALQADLDEARATIARLEEQLTAPDVRTTTTPDRLTTDAPSQKPDAATHPDDPTPAKPTTTPKSGSKSGSKTRPAAARARAARPASRR